MQGPLIRILIFVKVSFYIIIRQSQLAKAIQFLYDTASDMFILYGGPISRDKCRSPCDDVDVTNDDVDVTIDDVDVTLRTKTLNHVIISAHFFVLLEERQCFWRLKSILLVKILLCSVKLHPN